MDENVSVIYIARPEYGPERIRMFADAYGRHRPGVKHQLLVAAKGFDVRGIPPQFRDALRGLPHEIVQVPDVGLDIATYRYCAQQLRDARYLCFLNSFSEPAAEDWLAKLMDAARRPEVGASGATGSYESWYDDYMRAAQRIEPRRPAYSLVRCLWYLSKGGASRLKFHPFPNPHLRTNAFVIARQTFLRLQTSACRSKAQALEFESGIDGMTNQLLRFCLRPLVVGASGESYDVSDWCRSQTFRQGAQANLLVHDKQTRGYERASSHERIELCKRAWGATACLSGRG
jgi:hypothetical protein